jgi:hypothetical protein
VAHRRISTTPEHIENQQKCAQLGTLTHWTLAKHCERKLQNKDVRVQGNVTFMAVASHYGNITCLACREEAWDNGVRP